MYTVTKYDDAKRGPLAWRLDWDGTVIARAGLQEPWDGLAMAWFEFLDHALLRAHTRMILKVTQSMLHSSTESGLFWRIEAHVEANDPRAVRFI